MSWAEELLAAAEDIMGELGATVTVGAQTIQGIFFAAGAVVTIGGEEFVVNDPRLQVLASDVDDLGIAGGASGTELIYAGTSYTVLAVVPDGHGFAWLTLKRTVT